MVIAVNLGCGRDKMSYMLNVDLDAGVKPDLLLDININPLPQKASYIWADNVLEHLDDGAIRNIYDSLIDVGILEGVVPHYLNRNAYNDYQHKHYFNINTFRCPLFKGFRIDKLDVWYCFSDVVRFRMPLWFVRLHERVLPGILPPTHIRFKLIKMTKSG